MYASNRYEREMMRIPQNYSGNAFSSTRSREDVGKATEGAVSFEQREEKTYDTSQPQEKVTPLQAPLVSENVDNSAAPQVKQEQEPPVEQTPKQTAGQGLLPWLRGGLGQEELMLLGLLYLLYSGGSEGGDEIMRLLLLLLLIG